MELSLEYPDVVPMLTFATDRDARLTVATAFNNRAWPANDEVLVELMKLRQEHSSLLGYDGWPSYDAEVKMIETGDAIPAFIDKISKASEASALRDRDIILERIRQDRPDAETLDGADTRFYIEAIKREQHSVDAQEVRRYFAFEKVRQGLLDVTGRLFDLGYTRVDAPTWHADVASYDVTLAGQPIGRIHLDLHPRANKFNHAAQFTLTDGVTGRQLPEGVLVCNFPAGADGARRRGHALPRVRPPHPPRASAGTSAGPGSAASPPSGTSSRRPRSCSRSGRGTRASCRASRPTRTGRRSRPTWWRGCGRRRTSPRG